MWVPRWTSLVVVGLAGAVLGAPFAGRAFPVGAQEAERNPQPEVRIRPEAKLVPQRQWEYKQLPCLPTAPLAREHGDFADRLNEDGRVEELSRMLGGEAITEGLRRSAREMLEERVAKPATDPGTRKPQ